MCKDGHPTTLSCAKNKKKRKKNFNTKIFIISSLNGIVFFKTPYFLFYSNMNFTTIILPHIFIFGCGDYRTRIFTPNGANPGIRMSLVSIDFPRCRCSQAFCNGPQFGSIFSLDSPFHLYPNS